MVRRMYLSMCCISYGLNPLNSEFIICFQLVDYNETHSVDYCTIFAVDIVDLCWQQHLLSFIQLQALPYNRSEMVVSYQWC